MGYAKCPQQVGRDVHRSGKTATGFLSFAMTSKVFQVSWRHPRAFARARGLNIVRSWQPRISASPIPLSFVKCEARSVDAVQDEDRLPLLALGRMNCCETGVVTLVTPRGRNLT